ncbi:hypothetical protein [Alkalibaculum sporogenes]|nr:hypothetical protein [Alkalibaculum sporogenes]
MSGYTTNEIAPGFYCIEHGIVRSFLIEGNKDALLIDTGLGNDDFKK